MTYFGLNNGLSAFRQNLRTIIAMSGKSSIEHIKQNAEVAKQTINELKNELSVINKEYNSMLISQLRDENAKLLAAVDDAKKKLVHLETKNGIKQIQVPNQKNDVLFTPPAEPVAASKEAVSASTEEKPVKAQPKKEKKPKEVKPAPEELPVDIGRLDLRIGTIENVERHPDADALYVLKINCGEDKPRTVCSGLVKHVPIEELRDRTVMVLCNLKPVKMRGIVSEAMVMCASSEAGVEVLLPPEGSQPGELVHCEGFTRQPDSVMNPKKKIFETVATDLHTNDNLEACYKNIPLMVPGKGNTVAKSLKNVPVK